MSIFRQRFLIAIWNLLGYNTTFCWRRCWQFAKKKTVGDELRTGKLDVYDLFITRRKAPVLVPVTSTR